jgi:hypothetical protein
MVALITSAPGWSRIDRKLYILFFLPVTLVDTSAGQS